MFTNILLPVDLDQESSWERALPAAVEVSQKAGARLHVMTVVPDYGMSIVGSFFPENYEAKALENAAAALHTFVQAHVPKRIQVRHVVGHGTVYAEILREAQEVHADLIVLAAHRPALKDFLLGPNAARVVRHANCSVLVVRP
ncbi:MAG: universal stress protein [Rhodospirillaceae bacterium]|nr:universal stress protein [Rhodospirillaceae bacterium]MCA8932223.1 universal stress protein [Rhodospirillaceae bacterium]